MSAGSSLEAGAGLTLEQKVNILFAWARGGPGPNDAQGVPTDGETDLGGAGFAFRNIFAEGLRVGGQPVDLIALSGSVPVYVFTESDATWTWPNDRPRCFVFAYSGGGGGGGGATGAGMGGNGGAGGASTVTHSGTTVSTGQARGGLGGRQSGQNNARVASHASFIPPFPYYAVGGDGNVDTRDGEIGYVRAGHFLLTGLSRGDTVNVQVGAGGAGGTAAPSPATAGETGRNGFVMLFALPAP